MAGCVRKLNQLNDALRQLDQYGLAMINMENFYSSTFSRFIFLNITLARSADRITSSKE